MDIRLKSPAFLLGICIHGPRRTWNDLSRYERDCTIATIEDNDMEALPCESGAFIVMKQIFDTLYTVEIDFGNKNKPVAIDELIEPLNDEFFAQAMNDPNHKQVIMDMAAEGINTNVH